MDEPPFRNRVQDMRLIAAAELSDNQGNWRIHPKFQLQAIKGGLQEIGIWDALLAYHSERNEGRLVLLNGHGRKSVRPDQTWPVLILDINDEEADTILVVHDSITSWVQIDPQKLHDLTNKAKSQHTLMKETVERIQDRIKSQLDVAKKLETAKAQGQANLQAKYDGMTRQTVKLVVSPINVLTIEEAIKATGLQNRSEAITAVFKAYLEAQKGGNEKRDNETR